MSVHGLCPDGGACHHGCTQKCWRVQHCVPLSQLIADDRWPENVLQRHGNNEDIFWIVEEEEHGHDEMDAAVEHYVNSLYEHPKPGNRVTAHEYRRNRPTEKDLERWAEKVATDLVESLADDERFGLDEDAHPGYPKPTEVQKELALDFVRRFFQTWTPHWGTPTGKTEEVDLHEWCTANAPEMLEEG